MNTTTAVIFAIALVTLLISLGVTIVDDIAGPRR